MTTGVLTVTVTGTAGYVGRPTNITFSWLPNNQSYAIIDWGDGTIDDLDGLLVWSPQSSSHIYTVAKAYTISVTVADPLTGSGGIGTLALTIPSQVTATFTASPTGGKIPLAVTFTIALSGGTPPYNWTIDYGDGTQPWASGTTASPSTFTNNHTYNKVGSFTATFAVQDIRGEAFSIPLNIAGLLDGTLGENMLVIGGSAIATMMIGRKFTKTRKTAVTIPLVIGGAVLGFAIQRARGRI